MQVNNVQSPNFGMALKISKGAKEALKTLSSEDIAKLQKAGEDLKDTKFYHVKVDDDLSTKITADKDAYFGLFPKRGDGYAAPYYREQKNGGKVVQIENNNGPIACVGRYFPYGETEPFFNAWGVLGAYKEVGDVSQLSKIAKILDDTAVERYTASKAAIADKQKEEIANAVGNLLDSFGE